MKILCLGFDGVIHSYKSGWQGAMTIPDPPVPGALKFIVKATEHFEVMIYSSRSNQLGGIRAMKRYLIKEYRKLSPKYQGTPTYFRTWIKNNSDSII